MPFTIRTNTLEKNGKLLHLEYEYNKKAYNRKIPLFGDNKHVGETILGAGENQFWSVTTSEKNEKGFTDWIKVTKVEEGETRPATTTNNMPKYSGNGDTGGRFESAEERAKRQIYIIRQSSLSNAATVLGTGVSPEEVMGLAERFEAWVTREMI